MNSINALNKGNAKAKNKLDIESAMKIIQKNRNIDNTVNMFLTTFPSINITEYCLIVVLP
jgi:hypothetical protein